jgi:hypothetical protein
MAESGKKPSARGSNNSGSGKKGFRPVPLQADRERDRAITARPENQRVLVLLDGRHRRLMPLAQWNAMEHG